MRTLFAVATVVALTLSGAAMAQTVAQPSVPTGLHEETLDTVTGTGVTKELKDGTKIEVSAGNLVSVINADGSKTPAPDGTHILKDGRTVTTKDGKRASE